MAYYEYGFPEIQYLKERDEKLGEVTERIGFIRREVIPDLFVALVDSIIGQQISPKAAETVFRRLHEMLGEITPQTVFEAAPLDIQKCGLSGRKAGYIRSAAQAVLEKRLDMSSLPSMSDDEVIRHLTSLPGIGVWTAEMLLIFSLQRPDVVSFNDMAIRRGMMRVYGLQTLTKEEFEHYRRRYSPYGTIASLYLWAAAHEETK